VVCDSKILYLFGKLLKTPIKEAIPGSSFFTSYYMYHKDDANCKIFLLGAKEGIAAKAMERITFAADQYAHYACKLAWLAIAFFCAP
jgi:UDP-N-acetyl-D-mannosaminuronic acid transferase (WecB/TagA/CpsF family)